MEIFEGIIGLILAYITIAIIMGFFGEVIKSRKEIGEGVVKIATKIRTVNQSDFEKVLDQIEHTMTKHSKYSYFDYITIKSNYDKYAKTIYMYNSSNKYYKEYELLKNYVNNVNDREIISFFKDTVDFKSQYKDENFFLDCLGIENYIPIINIINIIDKKYWYNKLTEEEIKKIKLFILNKYILFEDGIKKNK